MSPSLRIRPSACWLPQWQVCLCVFLIALVAYNPFFGLHGLPDGFSYDTLARNRASVGASELQHFSPVSNPDPAPAPLTTDLPGAEPAPCVQEGRSGRDPFEFHPLEPALLAGVWFRPPPSR